MRKVQNNTKLFKSFLHFKFFPLITDMTNSFKNQTLQVIVFDIDGTLAETDEYYINTIQKVIRPIFFFISEKRTRQMIRKMVMFGETLLSTFYFLLDRIDLDVLFRSLHNRFSQRGVEYRYQLMEGCNQTLTELSKKYRLAIFTAGGEKSTEAFLKRVGLAGLFEVVVSSKTCRYTKPSGQPLRYIADQMGVQVKDCLMVGDTIFDLGSANNAGVNFIGVKSGFDGEWLLQLFGAKIIIPSVKELPDFLCRNLL